MWMRDSPVAIFLACIYFFFTIGWCLRDRTENGVRVLERGLIGGFKYKIREHYIVTV